MAEALLNTEVRLFTTSQERQRYENMADFYALFVAMEHLEKAYVRDAISHEEYPRTCSKLLAQYKTSLNLLLESSGELVDRFIEGFMRDYKLYTPAALNRFRIGVPATIEHTVGTHSASDSSAAHKYIAETVQQFITLMDSLKLNMVAVDQIHPLLSDLMQSLNRIPTLPPDFDGKEKIKNWLITLNRMKASQQLEDDQVRQLLFDLEGAYSAFYRSLSKE
ncbi:vacuolar protein sorting-associated [Hyaloraphidium curvatum]|nr:vacuolar protein sorting-associated [Hyaloraphidium curvatum]